MRTKFVKLAIMAFVSAINVQKAQAYNLSPISFENFYRIAAEGDLQGLKNVQRRGLNLDSTNINGDTAVCVAIKKQDYLAYKTLLRAGAKSNPDCVERLPEYAHKSFLANYNQKYAAPQTPTNWAKSGTAFVIGGGLAAGVVALAGSGGGGGGKGGSSNDASNSTNCELNPCAEGCYENITCAAGYQCTQYESKCNLGCTKCEQKPECVNVPECTEGCYTNLTCQTGYKCSKYNKCNGCEKCDKITTPDVPDTSNSRNCKDYNSAKNYCNTCNDGYTAVNGVCKKNSFEHCVNYDVASEKCFECESGYKLSSDKRRCEIDSGGSGGDLSCTAANYPLTSEPANAVSESCVDDSTTRYKIVSCNANYTLSSDGMTCNKNGSSGDQICDEADFPLTSEPENAISYKCEDKNGTHYGIRTCINGAMLSSDGLRCVLNCERSVYNLTECGNGSLCDSCTDSTGTYYKFNKCAPGFEQDGVKESCVEKELQTSYNDVANNNSITVDLNNGQTVDATYKKWLLGFTNYTPTGENVEANLYNARDKDASITIEDVDQSNPYPAIMGLASIYSRTPTVFNAYNNFKGEIIINSVNQNAIYGIMTTGGAYNSYGSSGTIKITRNTSSTDEAAGRLFGMGAWTEGIDSIKGIAERQLAGDDSYLYNAFGGSGLINLKSNKGDVLGMKGYNVVNATNGGHGTIEIEAQNGNAVGLSGGYKSTPLLVANAYCSSDEVITVGNIIITANNTNDNTIGIEGVIDNLVYNAYGKNAVGNITINGAGSGQITGILNGTNAAHGGQGHITINANSTDPLGKIVGIKTDLEAKSSKKIYYNGQGSGSSGSIKISVSGTSSEAIYGLDGRVDNGSADGGVGKIEIIDTGKNNITGINGGGNFANSSVIINSNADETKTIVGMSNERVKDYYKNTDALAANQNHGTIDITSTGRATVYGIYDLNVSDLGLNVLNDESGKITITSAGTEISGIYSGSKVQLINKGNITINATGNSISNMYGIKADSGTENKEQDKIVNTGNITINNVKSGMSAYGMAFTPNSVTQGLNNGKIEINVAGGTAYGVYSRYGLAKLNNGENGVINIAGYGTIYGAYVYTEGAQKGEAINYGAINITTTAQSTVYGMKDQINRGSIIIDDKYGSSIIGSTYSNRGTLKITTNSADEVVGMSGASNFGDLIINSTGNGIIYGLNKGGNDGNLIVNSPNSAKIYGIYEEKNISNTGNINLSGKNVYGLFSKRNDSELLMYYNIYNKFYYTGNGTDSLASINITTSAGTNYGIYSKNARDITNGNLEQSYNDKAASILIKTADTVQNQNNIEIYGIRGENLVGQITNTEPSSISISGKANLAYGIYASAQQSIVGNKYIFNYGDINISLDGGTAYGIYASGSNNGNIYDFSLYVKNTGNITLTNVNKDSSYGIYAINGSKVFNSGVITINGETYNKNEADGKFIYIDSTSSIVNENEISVNTAFDVSSLGGGKFVLAKGGKITAPEVKGEITADANITSGGFDKSYSSENAFSGKTDEVKLNSGSAMFDATLKNNDIVMTMKDFDQVVDNKSLAAYLQRNYNAKRNEQLFDSLKLSPTAKSLNSALNQNLGFALLPNFAQENLNVFRSLSNFVTDTMFAQDLTDERMMVGYDYLGQDRSSKGGVTGYENTSNSSYFLADTKLNKRQRFGLGVALTRFNSDYDDDSSRKATFAQVMGSFMHDFGNNWKYAGLLRAGYADGEYKRQADGSRINGDTGDVIYGLNNELRYNYDLGFVVLEPQLELNAYGYYQRKIKEDEAKTNALSVKGTNNLSVEAGAGLYASKETVYGENGKIKGRLGGSYYRELSQPYHSMQARVKDTDGYYLIESDNIFDRNRVIAHADITFSWKAFDLYLRGSQFMEGKHTTVVNAGVKYNF